MLFAPKDLPRAEEMVIDPALQKICNWRDPGISESAEPDDPAASIAFAHEHGRSIIRGALEAIALIPLKEPPLR